MPFTLPITLTCESLLKPSSGTVLVATCALRDAEKKVIKKDIAINMSAVAPVGEVHQILQGYADNFAKTLAATGEATKPEKEDEEEPDLSSVVGREYVGVSA